MKFMSVYAHNHVEKNISDAKRYLFLYIAMTLDARDHFDSASKMLCPETRLFFANIFLIESLFIIFVREATFYFHLKDSNIILKYL